MKHVKAPVPVQKLQFTPSKSVGEQGGQAAGSNVEIT